MSTISSSDNKGQYGEQRIRRSPQLSREIALEAAQQLLLSQGAPAVTLKGVADAVGMTHGNVTHHFGSSDGLKAQLVSRLAEALAARAHEAVLRLRRGEIDAECVVDLVFSAFDETGCGRLIGWLSTTADRQALAPVFDAIRRSVGALRAGEPETIEASELGAGPISLGLICHALTASLIGDQLENAAEMPTGSLRRLAASQLRSLRATEATNEHD